VDRPCRTLTRRSENRDQRSKHRRDRGTSSSSSSSSLSSRLSSSGRRRKLRDDVRQHKWSSHDASTQGYGASGAGDVRRARRRSSQKEERVTARSDDVCRRTDNTSGRTVRRTVLPTLKVGCYDGSTCLETFLAKFDNCCDYYSWNESEKLCHLRASLDGGAGQVLWDAGKQSSVDEIIKLLKNRFGTQNQDERYRAELKARRRRKGE